MQTKSRQDLIDWFNTHFAQIRKRVGTWSAPLDPEPLPGANVKLDKEQLRKIEQDIRSMVEHDNDLLNHRIQWFLTVNGFLYTAVAIYGDRLPANTLA